MIRYTDFSAIARFYEKLDALLPAPAGENPCRDCMECCRYLFYLSKYEFDFMEFALKQNASPLAVRFVPLLPGQRDPRFSSETWPCPLWMEHRGCCAYEGRPLACRLMGAYVPHNNTLIQDCVYKNPVVYTKVEEIPLWNDFMKLMRKYPSPPGYFVKEGQQC